MDTEASTKRAPTGSASMGSPHVVLIMTDQQRCDTLGCMSTTIETPNLDFLASQATIFNCAYTSTPSRVPARASLTTGMDPWHTGILGMGAGQPECANLSNTLPEVLSEHGYHTVGVGKMHFRPQRSLQGFHRTVLDESRRRLDPDFCSDYQQWFELNAPPGSNTYDHGIDANSWMARPTTVPEHLHPTNWTATEAIQAVRTRDPSRPLFLTLSFARPHSPYDPPSYYFDLYDRQALPQAAVGDWAGRNDVPQDAADVNAWRGKRSPAEVARARAGYFGSITHIDHQIGRVLIELRQAGLMENTLFVFTSDHGDMLGDHHLWRKTYGYEGSAHIPFIVRLPESLRTNAARAQSDTPVCLQDIMPTILEACDLPIPETVDGRSVVGECLGLETTPRRFVHGEHSTCYHPDQEMQYLTDGRWKYIWLPRLDEQQYTQEQLFDLAADPYECHDLAESAQHSDTLAYWRAQLVEILAAREAGLTDGDRLVSQVGKEYLRSPHAGDRTVRHLP